jgi:leucyl-tRNA synthetase
MAVIISFEGELNKKVPPIFISSKRYYAERDAASPAYRIQLDEILSKYVSEEECKGYKKIFSNVHVDVSFVNASDEMDIEAFKKWRPEYNDAIFLTEENGKYTFSREV